MSRRRTIIGAVVVGGIVLVLAGVAGAGWYFKRQAAQFFTRDAVQVIAGEVLATVEGGHEPSEAEIEEHIKVLGAEASVIHIRVDEGGHPVDYYGNPFRVSFGKKDGKVWAKCLTAGPDRREGTSDDIAYECRGQDK